MINALLVLEMELQYWLRLRFGYLIHNRLFLHRTAIPLIITISLNFMLIAVVNIILP
jgi:hypothetical protein